jgi:hypothetical protein
MKKNNRKLRLVEEIANRVAQKLLKEDKYKNVTIDEIASLLNDEPGYGPPGSVGAEMYRITFDNGYGLSIVKHMGSYGGEDGMYEVALTKNGEVVYDRNLFQDAIGYLSVEEVINLIDDAKQMAEEDRFELVGEEDYEDYEDE